MALHERFKKLLTGIENMYVVQKNIILIVARFNKKKSILIFHHSLKKTKIFQTKRYLYVITYNWEVFHITQSEKVFD